MTASVRLAARMLVPKRKNSTKAPTPNSACTIDGTPARLMTARLIALVSQLSRAYSLRYRAAATPIGTDATSATATSQIVPTRAGKMPPAVMPWRGKEKRNSIEIAGPPRATSTARMIPTGRISSTAMRPNSARTRRSRRRLRRSRSVASNIPQRLRTPRTTRSAVRLITKVTRNSRMPRVNSAW